MDCTEINPYTDVVQCKVQDPRLFHGVHGYIKLDSYPRETIVDLGNIYTPELRNHGRKYKTYSDIRAGDVLYYTTSQTVPYPTPNFPKETVFTKTTEYDSHGRCTRAYPRTVLNTPACKPVGKDACKVILPKDQPSTGLTWLDDTQAHRDQIMTARYASINRNKYMQ